ncbi:MAG: DMT family transporter [candidate division WOR-3 bacterium]
MKKIYLAIFALIPAIIWGYSFIATKYAVSYIKPATLGFVRFIISYVILEFLVFLRKENARVNLKDRMLFMCMGFFGITFYFLGENFGLKYTTSSNGALIVSTIPIFTLLVDKIVYRKKISYILTSGIILSFIGIYILLFGFSKIKNLNVKGDLVMFIPVLSWIIYTYISKMKSSKYSIFFITKEMTFYGSIFFIPFVFFEKGSFCIYKLNISTIISILYLGIVCSSLAYILWNKALKEFDEKLVNSFIYTIPIFTITGEIIILKTFPKINFYIALVLVITGLILTNFSKE